MQHLKNYFTSFLLLTVFSSCNSSQPNTLDNSDWLIGTWKGTTRNQTVFYESWQRNSDTLFTNTNYRIQNNDTIVGGKSKLFLRDGNFFYSNGLSNEKEKTWRATKYTPTEIVFENGALEKLQTIKFELTNNNQWKATIMINKDTVNYFLERIN